MSNWIKRCLTIESLEKSAMKTRKNYLLAAIPFSIFCLWLSGLLAHHVSKNRRQARNVASPQSVMLQHSGWHGASCPACREAIASRNR